MIDNIFFEKLHTLKCLCLTTSKHIKSKNHVEQMSCKCSETLGILNKLKKILLINVKTILHNSLMLHHFNYGILAWGLRYDKIIKLIRKSSM